VSREQEREFYELAQKLADISRRPGWEAMRYQAIGGLMEQLAAYCAVCDCQRKPVTR
jgi:hypothetical protein